MTAYITIDWCGKSWQLFRPADLETLWDAITDEEFTHDERLPYWVELWPASLALAALFEKQKNFLTGKTCLELGCGLGYSAIAGASCGARVIGMDYETQALQYAQRNAAHNGVSDILWASMDWRHPALKPHSCDIIWAGDIMYEQRFVEPVFAFLEYALKPGGCVWIAEPKRNIFTSFKLMLENNNWQAKCKDSIQVPAFYEQKSLVSVDLWELTRKP